MKEYYFIAENKQMGPFTVEELTNQNLTLETLVWSSGMDNWVILKDIPELLEVVKPSSAPPPIPSSFININTLKNSEPINVLIQKEQKQTFQLFGGNKKSLNWFIGWCIFHSFAMLMSYSQIPIFNDYGKPKAKKFWPFVNYHEAPYQNF